MPDRQYIACAFRPGDPRGYTYFNDGPPVAIGDRVVVATKRGEQKVSVVAIVPEPPFVTKGIVRMVEMPAEAKPALVADLPEDELPI